MLDEKVLICGRTDTPKALEHRMRKAVIPLPVCSHWERIRYHYGTNSESDGVRAAL